MFLLWHQKKLPKSLSDDKNLKREEFDWTVSHNNITYLKWKDKRCVNILSMLENPIQLNAVDRKEKDQKSQCHILKPFWNTINIWDL